ncbi:uncharacterized protein SAPINGB_P004529 [Magnusiomyces paraingens]|uniref:D-arabinono-1,4-lactone oxidase n=1 Tax=Magnusiomyces paraingens TaxID=2606893 RepID=A0A5E8BV62_9ASCO|nr:uncharacterized protein SAPINGB_P004529 [Saprochaete ingens]VVT55303.1 unnamed protein product [Saprochaete ingens]
MSLNLPSSEENAKNIRAATVSRRSHRTWAGTFYCAPELYLQPSSIDELKSIVVEAHRQKKRIMLTGSGHSPSDLTMTLPRGVTQSTGEWLVNLDRFNKPVSLTPAPEDAENKETPARYTDVKLEAGIRIYQINDYLKTKNLAIQNLGSISEQSVAGIISTGTHGSSAYHGLVSQQFVSLSVLIASGEIIECSETQNPDLFRAALLSLGKIGIIVYATIRTVPAFTIHSKQEVTTFDNFVDNLWGTFWTSSEYLRVWWFPYSNRVILWRANKSTKPLSAPRDSWYGTTLGRLFYQFLLWVAVKVKPSLTPAIEKYVFNQQYGLEETYDVEGKASVAVQGSVEGLNMDCLFSQFVDEWGLPLKYGQKVLYKLREQILAAAKSGEYYVHAPIEVRCSNLTTVAPTDAPATTMKLLETVPAYNSETPHIGSIPGNSLGPFLNPSPNDITYAPPIPGKVENDNLTLYLNATMYRPFGFDSPIDKWFRVFEDIVYEAGGKPHWAKNFLGNRELPEEEKAGVKRVGGIFGLGGKKVRYETDGQMRGLAPQVGGWWGEDLESWKRVRKENDPDDTFLSGANWAEINGLL